KNSNKLYDFIKSDQGILRSNPEAFFAKKIVLCEGATEVGIVRGINNYNYKNNDFRFSNNGVRYLDCGGDSKIKDCLNMLINKEYDVLVFCDSDNDINPKVKELKQFIKDKSIDSIQCESGKAIENQIFTDLNFETIKKIFELELLEDKNSIKDSIKSNYIGASWNDDFLSNDNLEIRNAFGISSNKNKWIKRIDMGTSVGELCMGSLNEFKDKHLYKMLTSINDWASK
ncbi:MAG: hypothetical protein O9267_14545, partial [Flavobacterium sp.]|uniref:TOPRIM nucleotidyl transferase/hydrolase domain-containing protein n=1 Tax=Flavobacterium sp. TaxID=239 RepID=UPI0022BFFE83